MKKILTIVLGLLVIVGGGRVLLKLPAVQDRLLEIGTSRIAERAQRLSRNQRA